MRLTIIGCSGSMSGPKSPASSYLVQAEGESPEGGTRTYSLLLDIGPGAMGHLLRYLDPAALDAIAISHLHADHCADLVGMQVYRKWNPYGALGPVPVYSPEDGHKRMLQLSGDDPEDTYEGEYEFHRIRAGDSFTVGPMHVEVFAALHTVEAVAFRITGPAEASKIPPAITRAPMLADFSTTTSLPAIRPASTTALPAGAPQPRETLAQPGRQMVLTYTGDTDLCESQIAAAKDADFLLAEAAYQDGREKVRGVHMTGGRAGKLARMAGVKRLGLTHLQPWTQPAEILREVRGEYAGPASCVAAGEVYRI
ncbi:Ribonuclease BN, tRNA processing enzyme [Actinobaculum suis]|uniref:MBL fold metallo-hydrolase n=1 Tax=Actinobaculum suis TaxID=1657 RepID=A0A0K9ETK7_9ACTO|nr:MBL fold metallo-hydrolase [Actinobaculum suis]KMY23514.1 beta-lactamase [Actinobaculum suis]MDY5153312.1 MBL fold metallo-hydrolase [Actinobaculum suis]SDE47490.1 Ribonuclease BN, tRNA processing enzyme [Actinobaculum suis]VDG76228.1 metal-dependent hydrolase [Actinobaculum suis]